MFDFPYHPTPSEKSQFNTPLNPSSARTMNLGENFDL